MTRHIHAIRRHALRAARAAYGFLGPVAGAVRGELSKEERVRAISKAVIFGATSGTTILATLKQPDTLTEIVVPITTAALAGIMDAVFHHQCGAPETAADPAAPNPTPPAPSEAPPQ